MFAKHISSIKAFLFAGLLATVTWASAAVDVNNASSADLDSVKGVGPGTSAKIAAARKDGPFKDWADLIERVKGIGPGSAAKLSANGLTVNGQSYKGDTEPPKAPAAKATAKAGEPTKKP